MIQNVHALRPSTLYTVDGLLCMSTSMFSLKLLSLHFEIVWVTDKHHVKHGKSKLGPSPVRFSPAQDDLFQRTLEPVKTALKDSGLAKSDVNTMTLAGSGRFVRAVSSRNACFF